MVSFTLIPHLTILLFLLVCLMQDDKKKKQKQARRLPTPEEEERYKLEQENAQLRAQLSLPPQRRDLVQFREPELDPEPEPEPELNSDDLRKVIQVGAHNPIMLMFGLIVMHAAAQNKTKKKELHDEEQAKPTP